MSTLIKNGRIVTVADDFIADLFIEDNTISAIGKNLPDKADKIIDATDKLIFPGGIDPHVHLDIPFMGTYSSDNYETGTKAALFGGTTSIIDFAIQIKGQSLQAAVDEWRRKSEGNAYTDYSHHIAVTDFNTQTQPEVKKMIDQGITSFKTFNTFSLTRNSSVRLSTSFIRRPRRAISSS